MCGGFRQAVRPRGGGERRRERERDRRRDCVHSGLYALWLVVLPCQCVSQPAGVSVCTAASLRALARMCVWVQRSLCVHDRWRWHDCVREDEREGPVRALHAHTCKHLHLLSRTLILNSCTLQFREKIFCCVYMCVCVKLLFSHQVWAADKSNTLTRGADCYFWCLQTWSASVSPSWGEFSSSPDETVHCAVRTTPGRIYFSLSHEMGKQDVCASCPLPLSPFL